MTKRAKPLPKELKTPQRDEAHRNKLLDEALEETFPASDPPSMLEPKARREK
jgi:hypothetical protein